jgi:hypothetical protein
MNGPMCYSQVFPLRGCSATIRSHGRVASFRDVTELLVVVGARMQELSDVFGRHVVRLAAVG